MPEGMVAADRIDGWAGIARHLRCDITTAIRWTRELGMPVHQPSGRRGAVHAFRHELDAWLAGAYHHNEANGKEKSQPDPPAQAPAPVAADAAAVSASAVDQPVRAEDQALKGAASTRPWQRWSAMAAAVLVACALFITALRLRHSPAVLTASDPTPITRSHTRMLSPLLSDGAYIFYQRYQNGRYSVAAVPVGGGASADVRTSLRNPELCDLTTDGRRMLLRDLAGTRDQLNPLYIQPVDGAAERVGDILAYDAAWYPDGKSILYSADGVVYSSDTSGTARQRLFSVPGNAYWFRWSLDGKRLRFTVIDKMTEQTSIWEAKANGDSPHMLFPEMHHPLCCGSWDPDGRFFYFQAQVYNRFEIWAARGRNGFFRPGRHLPFPLISGAESYRGPLPSRDGKKLFVRAEARKGEVVRLNSKAGEFLPIMPSISVLTLAYSKDGDRIAYTSLTDKNLWRCRTDGTQCLRLTQDFKNTVMPSWSPDGRMIAFMGIGFTGAWKNYLVPANGGQVKPLSHNAWAMGYPDWSPDGQKLVFSEVPPLSQPRSIYVLDLHTNHVSVLPESSSYFFPRWSHDGHSLVALHSGDQYLYVFNFDSKRWRPLTKIPSCYPSWSHDDKYIYFLPLSPGIRAIYRVAVANGAVEKVASLADVERGPFFLGDWIGLAPDDSPLAVRDSTMEDIYAWDLGAQ